MSTITADGQITMPAEVPRQLGVGTDDAIEDDGTEPGGQSG
ncbi:MAG: hypothetical protein ACRD1G_02285 [Acidimicrobiales bacterium]